MSSWARAWAYEQTVGETVNGKWRKNPGAKSVLAAICEFPDQDGRCYVGQKTLARMCDMSERTIRTHLAFLENDAELIRRQERRRKDGTRTSDYVWVLAPPNRLRPPDLPADFAGSDPSTGKSRRTNRKILSRQPENIAGHYPLEEPLVEPSVESARDSGEVRYLDDATQEIVKQLLGTKNWDKSEAETIAYVTKAKTAFAHVDLVALSRTFAFKVNTDAKLKYTQPSRAFSNWASREKPEPKPRITEPTRYTPEQRAGFARVLAEQEERRKRQLAEFLEPDVDEGVG